MSDEQVLDILGPADGAPRVRAPSAYALTGGPLSLVKPERVRWLWPGRVPAGKLTILDGDPGLGKSTLTLDLAARVSRGRPMPDDSPTEQGAVLLFTAEDGLADTVRPRLDALGADVEHVHAIDGATDGTTLGAVSFPVHADALHDRIVATRALLVIIDPLVCYLHGTTNTRVDADVRQALAPLARVAETTGAAVVVVRHLNKSAGASAIYRGGGSIGIVGAARSALLVAKDPEDDARRVLAVVKSNLAQLAPSLGFELVGAANGAARVAWLGESHHGADALVATPANGAERGELDEAVDFLRDFLADGERTSKEVEHEARAAGLSPATLKRAKSVAGVESERTGGIAGSGVWVWRLRGSTKRSTEPLSESGATPPLPLRGSVSRLDERLSPVDPDTAARDAMREGA